MNSHIKKISLMGIFIALGVSLGFALINIPNVELITATIFISGYLLGIKEGIVVGLLTESLYSLLNPFGMAAPPLFIAQILSMAMAGFMGAVVAKQKSQKRIIYYLKLGLAGFLATAIFALLTTLSFVLLINFSFEKLAGSFIYGLGFYIVHIVTNTIIFLTLVPAIINLVEKTDYISVQGKS